jgi:uncharacterized protein involved in exopolysaccharide biosynthesis
MTTASEARESTGEQPASSVRPRRSANVSASPEEVSLADVLGPLVRRWKLLFGLPLGFAVFIGIVSLILPSVYTSETTLTPAATSSIGGLGGGALASLAGLAGQLGVSSASGTSLSPDFIAYVLKSREVLTSTLESRFPDPSSGNQERPLLDIMRAKGRTDAARLSQGVRMLDRAVKTKVDHATGIVTLSVNASDPKLAAAVANRMKDILNDFNLERRQSQSREQARFTHERMVQAEAELRDAEAAQLRFLQANREFTGSPILEFQNSRLQRAVDLKQEVYVSLAKEYDQARIAEVRDTPVITTIDSAVAPDRRSSPRPLLNAVIALIAGGIFAFALIYLLEQRHRLLPPGSLGGVRTAPERNAP